MSRRVAVRLAVGAGALLALVLALPVPRSILVGFCRGESFYKGRPTSHWRGVVKRWSDLDMWIDVSLHSGGWSGPGVPPPPRTLFDRLKTILPGLDATSDFIPPPDWENDPAAVPVLSDLLCDPDADVRGYAALTISNQGPSARTALPRLVALLEHDDAEVRRSSAIAVARIETRAEVRVPLLLRMLKDRDPMVRRRVANLFGEGDGPPDEAVPALREALEDEDEQVRAEAAAALKKSGQ